MVIVPQRAPRLMPPQRRAIFKYLACPHHPHSTLFFAKPAAAPSVTSSSFDFTPLCAAPTSTSINPFSVPATHSLYLEHFQATLPWLLLHLYLFRWTLERSLLLQRKVLLQVRQNRLALYLRSRRLSNPASLERVHHRSSRSVSLSRHQYLAPVAMPLLHQNLQRPWKRSSPKEQGLRCPSCHSVHSLVV